MTYDPYGTHAANVQNAACRPATFLYYVYTSLFAQLSNTHPAMCALGSSAGSAAIAYSLAYYGASGWLDNVELLSGPVLSDIEQGCGVGNGLGANVTICDPNSKNGGVGLPAWNWRFHVDPVLLLRRRRPNRREELDQRRNVQGGPNYVDHVEYGLA